MSVRHVAWVLDNWEDDGKCSQFKAMIALAEWADDDGVCFPSIPQIATRIRRHERNVAKLLVALEERGELIVAPPKLNGSGTNAYLMVLNHTGDELVALLKKHKSLRGRIGNPVVVVADTVAKLTRREPHHTPSLAVLPEAEGSEGEETESLFEGEFTAEKELQLLTAGSLASTAGANWDADQIHQLQLQFERSSWKLKQSHVKLLLYLQHATGWDAPTIVRDRRDWAKSFTEHYERFTTPMLIGDLYSLAWARLQQQRQEAQAKGTTLSLRPRPGTLTNTMVAIHAEGKEETKPKGIGERYTQDEIDSIFSAKRKKV
jgi:hypothetical protein